jgi:hypothetical protein
MKIQFLPGCFDNFDGSQEELDEFIAEITKMVETGEIFENSTTVDLERMLDEDPEQAIMIMDQMGILEDMLGEENRENITYSTTRERRLN